MGDKLHTSDFFYFLQMKKGMVFHITKKWQRSETNAKRQDIYVEKKKRKISAFKRH